MPSTSWGVFPLYLLNKEEWRLGTIFPNIPSPPAFKRAPHHLDTCSGCGDIAPSLWLGRADILVWGVRKGVWGVKQFLLGRIMACVQTSLSHDVGPLRVRAAVPKGRRMQQLITAKAIALGSGQGLGIGNVPLRIVDVQFMGRIPP